MRRNTEFKKTHRQTQCFGEDGMFVGVDVRKKTKILLLNLGSETELNSSIELILQCQRGLVLSISKFLLFLVLVLLILFSKERYLL